MKIRTVQKLLLSTLFSTLAIAAGAQTGTPGMTSGASTQSTSRQSQAPDQRASEVLDKKVKSPQGEALGEIQDMVIDIDNQRVHYVVMSVGGTLGLGEKKFALPADRLQIGGKDEELVLNVTKEELQKAPGLPRDKAANYSDETYRTAVDRYFFKEEIIRHTPAGARLVGARDIIGKEVNDRAAHDAGEIADLVVNFGTGRAYAVMAVDKSWSLKEKLVALPLPAVSFPSRPDLDLLLNVDRPKIENARGFENNKWPDLNTEVVQKQIKQELEYFQAQAKPNPGATQTGRETSSGASR